MSVDFGLGLLYGIILFWKLDISLFCLECSPVISVSWKLIILQNPWKNLFPICLTPFFHVSMFNLPDCKLLGSTGCYWRPIPLAHDVKSVSQPLPSWSAAPALFLDRVPHDPIQYLVSIRYSTEFLVKLKSLEQGLPRRH